MVKQYEEAEQNIASSRAGAGQFDEKALRET